MDAIAAILGRRVVRAFADRPVELEKLRQIIEAGRHAMSARNRQPWRFIVVRDRPTLSAIGKLCETGPFVADAPAAIVVLKDAANTQWGDVDCAQAVQNIANAAWALGLGTCWVGHLDRKKIGTMLGVPKEWAVLTVLPIGYPDPGRPAGSMALKKRSETVYFERYGRTSP